MKKYNNGYPIYTNPYITGSVKKYPGYTYIPTYSPIQMQMYTSTGQLPVDEDYDEYVEQDQEQNQEQDNREEDLKYMKGMFPDVCKRIQGYVDEECDRMDYEGSAMYDEYPDRNLIEKVTDKIYDTVERDESMCSKEVISTEGKVEVTQRRNQWLRHVINILLLNEIYRRRYQYANRYGRRNRNRYRNFYYPMPSDRRY